VVSLSSSCCILHWFTALAADATANGHFPIPLLFTVKSVPRRRPLRSDAAPHSDAFQDVRIVSNRET